MNKHVSYDKLSKKEKRQVDAIARKTFYAFGCLSSVIRVVTDKKKEKQRRNCREKQIDIQSLLVKLVLFTKNAKFF